MTDFVLTKFWTVEKDDEYGGIYIDDILPTQKEAEEECKKRGPEWNSVEIELNMPVLDSENRM